MPEQADKPGSDSPEGPDRVRLAHPSDAARIGQIQVAAWQQAYADVLPADLLANLDAGEFARVWADAIGKPAQARDRVLVALDMSGQIAGFAAVTMSDDDDAEPGADGLIAEFAVDPALRREGHGSRLLNAAVDTLAADGMSRATIWVNSTADQFRQFLTDAGLVPDGAHRTLTLAGDAATPAEGVQIKQVRLHCATASTEAPASSGDDAGT